MSPNTTNYDIWLQYCNTVSLIIKNNNYHLIQIENAEYFSFNNALLTFQKHLWETGEEYVWDGVMSFFRRFWRNITYGRMEMPSSVFDWLNKSSLCGQFDNLVKKSLINSSEKTKKLFYECVDPALKKVKILMASPLLEAFTHVIEKPCFIILGNDHIKAIFYKELKRLKIKNTNEIICLTYKEWKTRDFTVDEVQFPLVLLGNPFFLKNKYSPIFFSPKTESIIVLGLKGTTRIFDFPALNNGRGTLPNWQLSTFNSNCPSVHQPDASFNLDLVNLEDDWLEIFYQRLQSAYPDQEKTNIKNSQDDVLEVTVQLSNGQSYFYCHEDYVWKIAGFNELEKIRISELEEGDCIFIEQGAVGIGDILQEKESSLKSMSEEFRRRLVDKIRKSGGLTMLANLWWRPLASKSSNSTRCCISRWAQSESSRPQTAKKYAFVLQELGYSKQEQTKMLQIHNAVRTSAQNIGKNELKKLRSVIFEKENYSKLQEVGYCTYPSSTYGSSILVSYIDEINFY